MLKLNLLILLGYAALLCPAGKPNLLAKVHDADPDFKPMNPSADANSQNAPGRGTGAVGMY